MRYSIETKGGMEEDEEEEERNGGGKKQKQRFVGPAGGLEELELELEPSMLYRPSIGFGGGSKPGQKRKKNKWMPSLV